MSFSCLCHIFVMSLLCLYHIFLMSLSYLCHVLVIFLSCPCHLFIISSKWSQRSQGSMINLWRFLQMIFFCLCFPEVELRGCNKLRAELIAILMNVFLIFILIQSVTYWHLRKIWGGDTESAPQILCTCQKVFMRETILQSFTLWMNPARGTIGKTISTNNLPQCGGIFCLFLLISSIHCMPFTMIMAGFFMKS